MLTLLILAMTERNQEQGSNLRGEGLLSRFADARIHGGQANVGLVPGLWAHIRHIDSLQTLHFEPFS